MQRIDYPKKWSLVTDTDRPGGIIVMDIEWQNNQLEVEKEKGREESFVAGGGPGG